MDFLKTIGGKVATGLVALAVVAAGISWYEMDPGTRHGIVSGTMRICSWVAIVLAVPWVTFFVIGWVAKLESNLAGGALIVGYTLIEAVLLAWLFSWSIKGPTAVGLFGAAVLVAGAYNLLMCDWIAEKVE
jgi:FtsH-binding integral membrane protein